MGTRVKGGGRGGHTFVAILQLLLLLFQGLRLFTSFLCGFVGLLVQSADDSAQFGGRIVERDVLVRRMRLRAAFQALLERERNTYKNETLRAQGLPENAQDGGKDWK